MSKPRKVQSTNGVRIAPVSRVILEIIANRTGSVSSDEVYGALINNWVLPSSLKQDPRKWVAVMLTGMADVEFIKKTGTHCKPIIDKNGKNGAVNLAMYDITGFGKAFLAGDGDRVPKRKPESLVPLVESESIIPRDCVSAWINRAWPAPVAAYRKPSPAAAHLCAGALS